MTDEQPVWPVGTVVETLDDVRSGCVGGPLYRVVAVEGVTCHVRRIDPATGDLEPQVYAVLLASDLRAARPAVVRRYEALGVRSVLGQWRRAAADDAEDFGIVESLLERAGRLAALTLDGGGEGQDAAVAVSAFPSLLDDAHVVQIDTTEATGRVRVFINDGAVYDGDPETDEPPGAHYSDTGWGDGRRLFSVRSLMTGETSTFRAANEADATAQYLDVVTSNLLVWPDTDVAGCGPGGQS